MNDGLHIKRVNNWTAKFVDAAPDAFFLLDKDLTLLEVNKKGLKLLGKPRSKVIGKPMPELAPRIPESRLVRFKEVAKTGKAFKLIDAKAWAPAGERYADIVSFRIGNDVGVIITDIDEKHWLTLEVKKNRERIKTLALAYIKAQEQEREIIACEIHDRVIQLLSTSYLLLDKLAIQLDDSPVGTRIDQCSQYIKTAVAECRAVTKQLYPSTLAESGLIPLINEELNDLNNNVYISVDFVAEPAVNDIPRPIAETVYRIFHEAALNIRKHAKARKISVTIKIKNSGVELNVSDDGIGFEVTRVTGKRLGLTSMRRRAELLGGYCHIESTRGEGTIVSAYIPFELDQDHGSEQ